MVNLAVKTKATAFLLNSTMNLVFYEKGKVKFSTVTSLVLHSFTTFGIHLFHLTSWNKLFPNVRNSLLFTVIFNCNILSLINLTTPWCAVKWKIWSTSITGSQGSKTFQLFCQSKPNFKQETVPSFENELSEPKYEGRKMNTHLGVFEHPMPSFFVYNLKQFGTNQ